MKRHIVYKGCKWCIFEAFLQLQALLLANFMFNQDISNWETSRIEYMENVFENAAAFNQDISKWDTGAVTSMNGMFGYACEFNQDISEWDTGAVTSWSTCSWAPLSSPGTSAAGVWIKSKFRLIISTWDPPSRITRINFPSGALAPRSHEQEVMKGGKGEVKVWRKGRWTSRYSNWKK